MKIAQVSPLFECVPPKLYGGTERVVSYLTEELVRQGHEVTLFASGDSRTTARLVACCNTALRLDPTVRDPVAYHVIALEQVRRRASEFDLLHFHIDYLHAPLVAALGIPSLTTHHGRLDLHDIAAFYEVFSDLPLVSISESQRRDLPNANWLGTVRHGLPRDLLPFSPQACGGYLAFLGRISPEKRPDWAIEIACRTGMPLKIAAKVDRADQAYWDQKIRPLVEQHANVEFIGEIGEREKARFLGDAAALLFHVDWPEPFGLALIEAMSCGTPAIAFRRGSVAEILNDGVSGFIVETIEEAARAVERLPSLSRALVRKEFESRFTVQRMAQEYLGLYRWKVTLAGSLSAARRN